MTALTIGMFDGVHLGHQHLLARMKELGCPILVITFSNHPAEILGQAAPPLLISHELKCSLLTHYGADEIKILPFTHSLAAQSYETFLEPYQFQHLFLGEGATLGYRRLGTAATLRTLGEQRGFTVHTIPKLLLDGHPISSTRIRAVLQQGNRTEAEQLLGHKL